mgnify:CR=1 FL=1
MPLHDRSINEEKTNLSTEERDERDETASNGLGTADVGEKYVRKVKAPGAVKTVSLTMVSR